MFDFIGIITRVVGCVIGTTQRTITEQEDWRGRAENTLTSQERELQGLRPLKQRVRDLELSLEKAENPSFGVIHRKAMDMEADRQKVEQQIHNPTPEQLEMNLKMRDALDSASDKANKKKKKKKADSGGIDIDKIVNDIKIANDFD